MKDISSGGGKGMGGKFEVGEVVYYKGYLAEVLAKCGVTRFRKIRKYFIEPYPDQMWRTTAKETELLPAANKYQQPKPKKGSSDE